MPNQLAIRGALRRGFLTGSIFFLPQRLGLKYELCAICGRLIFVVRGPLTSSANFNGKALLPECTIQQSLSGPKSELDFALVSLAEDS